ncbi:Uncharacterized protein PBTT_10246 [Plasmodiophora brassicae]|uniref:Uncharacterized protein n=2 Tax=Plasmodiophora brassicae TaxID=37360 RepID=A0A3P3YNV2_PLABS|nr:unnamed protein product [Plasmodiophora brassicae]
MGVLVGTLVLIVGVLLAPLAVGRRPATIPALSRAEFERWMADIDSAPGDDQASLRVCRALRERRQVALRKLADVALSLEKRGRALTLKFERHADVVEFVRPVLGDRLADVIGQEPNKRETFRQYLVHGKPLTLFEVFYIVRFHRPLLPGELGRMQTPPGAAGNNQAGPSGTVQKPSDNCGVKYDVGDPSGVFIENPSDANVVGVGPDRRQPGDTVPAILPDVVVVQIPKPPLVPAAQRLSGTTLAHVLKPPAHLAPRLSNSVAPRLPRSPLAPRLTKSVVPDLTTSRPAAYVPPQVN